MALFTYMTFIMHTYCYVHMQLGMQANVLQFRTLITEPCLYSLGNLYMIKGNVAMVIHWALGPLS